MSCIHLSKKHYQYIADSLLSICYTMSDCIHMSGLVRHFSPSKNIIECETKIHMLVCVWQTWNVQARNERYGDECSAEEPDLIDVPTSIGIPGRPGLNIYQLYKAMQCVDYQCIDAQLFATCPARDDLQLLKQFCSNYLIDTHPEYESAQWCIE